MDSRLSHSSVRRTLSSWFGLVLVSSVLCSSLIAQSGNGSVAGSVTNAATRAFLEGAHVALADTPFRTLTGRDGQFELTGVPPGDYTLEVSYTGLDPQRQPVSVRAGRTE